MKSDFVVAGGDDGARMQFNSTLVYLMDKVRQEKVAFVPMS
jgi:hypothetical protein